MDGAENKYGLKKQVCDVCDLPLGGAPIVHDDVDQAFMFCSDRCYQTYLADPDKYTDIEEELE